MARGPIRVDLYSDTVTRPSTPMRQAIAAAEVGDEQLGEDPTVRRLEQRVAELMGKPAALFLPSGTMCNQVAFAVHCRPGDEIILDEQAHPMFAEGGGSAVLTGAIVNVVHGRRGVFSGEQLRAAIRPPHRHSPRSRLVSIEQTTNLGGGVCWPLELIAEVTAIAHDAGLSTHCDGARLMNAVIATGVAAAEYGAHFDSIWLDFSKGLGAPVGAAIAGSAEFIDEAWRWKQRIGGAMRQSGIIAAAGLYALDHNVQRLSEDHDRARQLAAGLRGIAGIEMAAEPPQTNIVVFDVAGTGLSAGALVDRVLEAHGVRLCVIGPTLVRAVTHLDVPEGGIEVAIDAVGAEVAAA